MGREVRMVPADWQHPKELRRGGMRYRPLYGGSYAEDAREWDEAARQWNAGFLKNYGPGEKWVARGPKHDYPYSEYAGDRPDQTDYMPDWPPEQRTHFMMYEDTSEGTPISPAFATAKELARWLADTGASAFGDETATYEQWLSTIKRGWACSAVLTSDGMQSGVAALADDAEPPA